MYHLKQVFMGGVGHGGYSTSILGEQMLDELAGLVLFAAGRWRASRDRYTPRVIKEKIRGKPSSPKQIDTKRSKLTSSR